MKIQPSSHQVIEFRARRQRRRPVNNLREFVYSRHPDPRRVWKGGSEQHLLTPLPRAPRAPGAPGVPRANSKKLYVVVFYYDFDTLALPFFGKKLYVAMFYNDFGTFARPIFF